MISRLVNPFAQHRLLSAAFEQRTQNEGRHIQHYIVKAYFHVTFYDMNSIREQVTERKMAGVIRRVRPECDAPLLSDEMDGQRADARPLHGADQEHGSIIFRSRHSEGADAPRTSL